MSLSENVFSDEINSFLLSNRNSQQTAKFQTQNVFDKHGYRIDYVLVYKKNDDESVNKDIEQRRLCFKNNLKQKGLKIEESEIKDNVFIKIHAPIKVLKRYCEVLKLRMPVKHSKQRVNEIPNYEGCYKIKLYIGHIINFIGFETKWVPKKNYKITAEYSQNKRCIFDDHEETFFSTSDRCLIVNFILEQTTYSDKLCHVGITKLLEQNIYDHAYPPHEGKINDAKQERGWLMENWATSKNIFSYQPIDEIKDYFGMKFALYFAWVGFYTYMLIPASIFGLFSFLYGYFTQDENTFVNEICDKNQSLIMCPQCDKYCDYYKISDACYYYKVRHLIDNHSTYVFSFFMSIWSALYLKLWKRNSAEITHRWGLTGFSLIEEFPRPDYQYENCFGNNVKKNDITKQIEPKVPFWRMKFPALIISYTMVFCWIILVSMFVFLTILYSMFFRSHAFIYNSNKYQEIFFVPVTTAILNFIFINILNFFYNRFAIWLTNIEFQRTQVQYDDSLQFKIYLFQFVNYYSSIFYIAFIKGRFIGTPGNYIRILDMRQEECDLGGCLLEVSIQIATFMLCEQLLNNIIEYIWPHLIKFIRSCGESNKTFTERCRDLGRGICNSTKKTDVPRWREDIELLPWDTELFDEYLEMVVQYGFVTIFVTAFPLAPLLALFNNVLIEKLIDAKKFIHNYRRPVAQRVANIGIWFYIMKMIAKVSIISNAVIIASNTNLIPMFLYKISHNGETKGYLNYSMSYFDVSNFNNNTRPENSKFNVTSCRYPEFRDENFKRTFEYWHILVAKLAFVLIYQNVVSTIVTIIQWCIPDISKKLKVKINKEESEISKTLLKEFETELMRNASHLSSTTGDTMRAKYKSSLSKQ